MTRPDTDRPAPVTRRDVLAGLGAAAGIASLPRESALAASPELPLAARDLWEWTRAQPLIATGLVHLDTAGTGPALRTSLVAEYRSREALNLHPGDYWRERQSPAAVTRFVGQAAAFAGTDPDEISFTTGATEALNIIAGGLPLEAGDEVVLTTHEHAAHLHAWLLQARRRGIVVRQVALPSPLESPEQVVALFTEALTPRTRVMAFSHVQYTDGALLPVRELCELARSRGIVSVVDGAQAFGMLNVAIRDVGCDYYAASLSKWLNGGQGLGLLYVRHDRLDQLWPTTVDGPAGWNDGSSLGLADPADAEWRSGWPAALAKFGTSYRYFGPLHQGLAVAFELQERIGRARVEARIRELALYTRLRLQELPGARLLTPGNPFLWAGIVSVAVPGKSLQGTAAALAEKDSIVVRAITHAAIGFDALRVSPHIYNSHDDVDRLVAALTHRLG